MIGSHIMTPHVRIITDHTSGEIVSMLPGERFYNLHPIGSMVAPCVAVYKDIGMSVQTTPSPIILIEFLVLLMILLGHIIRN